MLINCPRHHYYHSDRFLSKKNSEYLLLLCLASISFFRCFIPDVLTNKQNLWVWGFCCLFKNWKGLPVSLLELFLKILKKNSNFWKKIGEKATDFDVFRGWLKSFEPFSVHCWLWLSVYFSVYVLKQYINICVLVVYNLCQ